MGKSERFAQYFKALRLKKGLSQEQVANDLKVSRSSIGMYEQGKREPDFDTLKIIADYFNVDASELIGERKNPPIIDTKSMELIEMFSQLSDIQKDSVINLVRCMITAST